MTTGPGDLVAPQPAGFLTTLQRGEAQDLEARARKRTFRRGTTIFNEGDTTDRVVVVLAGQIKVSYFTEDGKEVLLAIRGPGDLLGELAALDGEPHSATATAIDPVEALVLTAAEFKAFLAANPRVALYLLELLSRKVRDADVKRIEFSAFDTVGRVARRLVELAQRFGEPADEGLDIGLALSQEELAGWTGCSREAASKALQHLRGRGWITTHRRRIRILDLPALERRAS